MGVIIERTEPGMFGEVYKHPVFNDFYISARANSGCKHCRGRGKLEFSNPKTGLKWSETCDCLFKN